MIYHRFLGNFLILEIIIIAVASLLMLFLYFYMDMIFKKHQKLKDELSDLIIKHLFKDTQLTLPKRLTNPKLMVVVLEDFDLKIKDKFWEDLKIRLTKKYLLDLARIYVYKKDWNKRMFAVKTFRLYCEPSDEIHILKLIDDKLQFIKLSSISAAMKLHTKPIIYKLMEIIGEGSRFSTYAYKDALANADEKIYYMIKEKYQETNDERIKIAGLEIFSFLTHHEKIDFIENELKSKNKIIRLLATKVLHNYPSKYSLEWLKKLALDKAWEIRAISAKGLGELNVVSTLPLLMKMLSDEEWWVRVNSGLAISNFGTKGKKILQNIDEDLDQFAFDTAQYVLSMDKSKR